jgi:hypothetical protein
MVVTVQLIRFSYLPIIAQDVAPYEYNRLSLHRLLVLKALCQNTYDRNISVKFNKGVLEGCIVA